MTTPYDYAISYSAEWNGNPSKVAYAFMVTNLYTMQSREFSLMLSPGLSDKRLYCAVAKEMCLKHARINGKLYFF